jgi:hypothetical protein
MGGGRDYFKIGDWNAQCAECGAKRKSSELRLTWDGFRTCDTCWQPRQPQDFVRATTTHKGVPWSNDRPPPTFVNTDTRPDGSDPAIVPMPVDSP